MESLKQVVANFVKEAFLECDYDINYADVIYSQRKDLCQFQCNGALAYAKLSKSNPMDVAENIVSKLLKVNEIDKAESCKPGFINITMNDVFISSFVNKMSKHDNLGVSKMNPKKKIVIDYGGPNVGKPLHVGHLRTAIIGESLKRVCRFLGHEVIGDIHLGDWGLQMGMIITELNSKYPDWKYFDEKYTGPYDDVSPISFEDFEVTYPIASKKAKENEDIMALSRKATNELQDGRPGYIALWKHFLTISKDDLKKTYDRLFVEFDLWNGESDVQDIIPEMAKKIIDSKLAYESDGAYVVDVLEPEDKREVPPFILLKSDGAALYTTTDLATILKRVSENEPPDEIWYVVDSRQAMHFMQVFRCAYKSKIANPDTKLLYLGFGTMNGSDGKPFKTRTGGVMKLTDLIESIEDKALERILENSQDIKYTEEEKLSIKQLVGVAALKYGDLMNFRSKDYAFDVDRFTSFEGRTGIYILYSTVRIKSILREAKERNYEIKDISLPSSDVERELLLKLTEYPNLLNRVFEEKAPNYLCEYVFDLASIFNRFYQKHRILPEENKDIQSKWLGLLNFTKNIFENSLDLLGIKVPEKL